MYYYSVIVPILIDTTLTYQSEKILYIGEFVIVTVKNEIHVGVVLEVQNTTSDSFAFEVKNVEQRLFLPRLSESYIKIFKKIAYHQMEPLGAIFAILLQNILNFWKQTISLDLILKNLNKNLFIANKNLSIQSLEDFINQKIDIKEFLYVANHYKSPIKLTEIQKNAFDELENPTNKNIILLEGETGSGKTIVYLEKIKKILTNDPSAQILILLPEIALTNAITSRVEEYIGIPTFSWHSTISMKERRENFLAIIFGIARIVVGARSAIFLPFHNLRLIIIDEEHDNSFKQDQQVLYQTVEIAKIIAGYNQKLQIILSSATPSLETIYNVKMKSYTRVVLKSNKTLQERMHLSIEDMSKDENKSNIISETIIEKIKFYLKKNMQSMIFLNKRGYNSVIICKKCNNRLECKNCSVGLIFHKELKRFFCSSCGFFVNTNSVRCGTCLEECNFKFYGYGVEKIHELISEKFPELFTENRIILLSSDNSKDLHHKIQQIEKGEVDIIIGTQILAKGHNFPKLAFLGIIDGGLNFSGVDLRSGEKTYQILHQIVGRLGRFQSQGEAIIQTLEPKNLILNALLEQNRVKFYTHELQQRKNFSMPPFSQLFKITFSHINQQKAEKNASKFMSCLDYNSEIEIIGPSPSSIIKVNNLYRYNILIKAQHNFDLQDFLYKQLEKNKINKLSFRIDISPVNFI